MSSDQILLDLQYESDSKTARPIEAEPQVLTVSELTQHIKGTLEETFGLVWIQGEISNFKPHFSGHWYFNLKDKHSQITAVMFKGYNSRLKFQPEDGMEVIVRARVTVYQARGNYQLLCEVIEPVGLGALQKAFEQLKAKLASEGLFDQNRKMAIPLFPTRIAIVTSPTGAAIRDMLNVLTRRFKCTEITLIPTPVQGATAAPEIARAIRTANLVSQPYDVIIVGRGGGSIEDLWAFNEELVARAIAESKIPIISAVGHEIDFTISDFVADLRAPTPSAAAELVVANAKEIIEKLKLFERSLNNHVRLKIQSERNLINRLCKHLIDPKKRLEQLAQTCDELLSRMDRCFSHQLRTRRVACTHLSEKLNSEVKTYLSHTKYRLSNRMGLLDSFSPLRVVERGYAIATHQGSILKDSKAIGINSEIELKLARGEITAKVVEIRS